MVMGTASTMGSVLEALGMTLPRAGTAPAVSAERLRLGVATGRRAVRLISENLRPSRIMTRGAFHNALVVLAALAGSTNAIIHLTAVARRLGITLDLEDVHEAARRTPVLVDCKPAGSRYLPDFHAAGGMPALLAELAPLLELDTPTVTGQTLGEQLESAQGAQPWQDMIRTLDRPLAPAGALVALRGSLFPGGAVIKASAASPGLMRHVGRAVVFESLDDVEARLEGPELRISRDDVLVLRNIGPAASGMPEAGAIPIPKALAREACTGPRRPPAAGRSPWSATAT